jgi:hypothetical protein
MPNNRQSVLLDTVLQTLHDLDEFLEGQADINWEGTGPNEAMSLQTQIRQIIRTLEAPTPIK